MVSYNLDKGSSMLIRVTPSINLTESEVTPQAVYQQRRAFLQQASLLGAGTLASGLFSSAWAQGTNALPAKLNSNFSVMDKPTAKKDATTYNNFYEFGLDKSDPAENSGKFKTRPWTVAVEGACLKPKVFDIDELIKLAPLEERIYRLRCVEAWSMVIPWTGYALANLLKKVEPTSNAKYVEFVTVMQPESMPGLRSRVLDWPYSEGLRIDEAMNPLTLLSFGMYGERLLNQNGAPLRLVVPWKYGFKSAKSLVKIRLLEKQPTSSWMRSGPSEYGFYANVNPNVPHPRWSQAAERRIGEDGIFTAKRKTLPFNGYADQVASLYQGMDLAKYF